jgi:hypothetical protein
MSEVRDFLQSEAGHALMRELTGFVQQQNVVVVHSAASKNLEAVRYDSGVLAGRVSLVNFLNEHE